MSKAQFTPGPWKSSYGEHNGYDCMSAGYDIDDANGDLVVTVDCADRNTDEESRANAQLIASAPELLEVVVECLRCIKDPDYDISSFEVVKLENMLEQAIRKATGQEGGA